MDLKLLLTVFSTVFVAELGDKTQFATLLYAAGPTKSKLTVFLGAALALVVASGIAVLAGSFLAHYINPKHLSWIAGLGFIGVGIWVITTA
ncbi:MAG: TMEM165/GDT1 family protein [Proteobacteria bacterium]|jgi:putative Ca2+/H+ antiporter (TMEM165/GDT1 family)|nr:TMEM165/GDT1 family protein [Pseudomonadota bacterium]